MHWTTLAGCIGDFHDLVCMLVEEKVPEQSLSYRATKMWRLSSKHKESALHLVPKAPTKTSQVTLCFLGFQGSGLYACLD